MLTHFEFESGENWQRGKHYVIKKTYIQFQRKNYLPLTSNLQRWNLFFSKSSFSSFCLAFWISNHRRGSSFPLQVLWRIVFSSASIAAAACCCLRQKPEIHLSASLLEWFNGNCRPATRITCQANSPREKLQASNAFDKAQYNSFIWQVVGTMTEKAWLKRSLDGIRRAKIYISVKRKSF